MMWKANILELTLENRFNILESKIRAHALSYHQSLVRRSEGSSGVLRSMSKELNLAHIAKEWQFISKHV
jgi:hypothetical protein